MMKTLKQLLFAMVIVIGVSMTASAQEDKGRKTPPKEGKPPVIVVPPRNPDKPKEDKPKNDDKRKKPEAFMFNFRAE
jgi:hypothetical protein